MNEKVLTHFPVNPFFVLTRTFIFVNKYQGGENR